MSTAIPVDDVNQIILQYLRSKGYMSAAQAAENEFRSAAPRTATGSGAESVRRFITQQGVNNSSGLVGDSILFWGIMEGDAGKILASYNALQEFIANSLDTYKNELASVSFPVFCHLYLDLISKGCVDDAKTLMDTWGSEHEELYKEEVESLRMVTGRDLLLASEFVQRLLENKFVVSLSTVCFDLLNSFLSSAGLLVITILLNMRVTCRVIDRPPLAMQQVIELGGGPPLQGSNQYGRGSQYSNQSQYSQQSQLQQNLPSLLWGALPGPEVAAYASQLMQKQKEISSTKESTKEAKTAASKAELKLAPGTAPASLLERAVPEKPPPMPRGAWETGSIDQLLLHPMDLKATPRVASTLVAKEDGLWKGTEQANEEIFLADPQAPTALCTTFVNCKDSLTSITQSKDASLIAAGFCDSSVKVWRKGPDSNETSAVSGSSPTYKLIGHSKPVYDTSFSPDSRFLLSASGDTTVRLWDLSLKEHHNLVAYKGHCCPVWCASFSPIGYYFATGASDRTARLWSTDYAQPLRLMVGHMADVTSIAFHPNCNYIVTGSHDKTARVWDVQAGGSVRLFAGHASPISCVAVSPDGRYVATGSDDKTIMVWDIPSGKRIAVFEGHTEAVECLDFSAEGSVLASGAGDNSVRTWDLDRAISSAAEGGHESLQVKLTRPPSSFFYSALLRTQSSSPHRLLLPFFNSCLGTGASSSLRCSVCSHAPWADLADLTID
ncbi:unnamed protein product [Chrysoparadoxa australica]